MDIVTFAPCKKMAQNNQMNEVIQQEIEEIRGLIQNLQSDKEEYNAKLQAIEEKIATVQTDRILAELQNVRERLETKVSAYIVE